MSKMKKVLIITYYWPPAGGPGVQRVLKFAKYLPQFGWQPIILTVKNGEYSAIDESLIKEIPKECIVYKTKTFEPYNLYKKFVGKKKDEKLPTYILNTNKNDNLNNKIAKWIRANLFIPDARIGWISHIVREGMKIIEKENPDIIFSSSPPHSLQIGAKKLAKKSGLKWVADFRD
ncbi:MAG: glycosyl transferase family 1, partial [Candidatus Marinimicrobia bacterium]|nr:glycosyl transferase family 1 [Candidatus Neomarinimicrobiota bacterium]